MIAAIYAYVAISASPSLDKAPERKIRQLSEAWSLAQVVYEIALPSVILLRFGRVRFFHAHTSRLWI